MIRIAACLLIVFSFLENASGQSSQVLYHMNLPQNHLANPAMRPGNSAYFGLPVISGINLNLNNNFVNFSDIFRIGSSDSIISILHPDFDVDSFLDDINNKNSIEPQFSIPLFGLGFSVGNNSYINFDIIDRVEGNLVIPGDLFELALRGNEAFKGSTIDLSSLRGDLRYFREFGLGFSNDVTDKLRIGIRAKVLFGIAGAHIDNKALGITISDTYTHTLDADVMLNISAPVNVYVDDENKLDSILIDDETFETRSGVSGFLKGASNIGMGLDLGVIYDLTDNISLSAAITDIGFISWKANPSNLGVNGHFEFSGFDMTEVINGTKTFDELGGEMVDSLADSFRFSYSNNPFTTYLPPKVYLGANLSLTNYFSVGLLSYTQIIGEQVKESITMSGNFNFSNIIATSISYTASNHRFDNLGLGLYFRPGIFQFYVLSDRIPVSWNKLIINDGQNNNSSGVDNNNRSVVVLPSNWNSINIRIGMNFVFGNGNKKKDDKPMSFE